MPSFSLKWMLAGVAAVALGCVALLNASDLAFAITFGVALLLLFAAVIHSILGTGATRSFAVGFAVVGWGYLLLVGGDVQSKAAQRLPTSAVIQYLWDHVPVRTETYTVPSSPFGGGPLTQTRYFPDWDQFHRLGHLECLLLLAFLGGLIARRVYATREADEDGSE